jgi:hypothetical protein
MHRSGARALQPADNEASTSAFRPPRGMPLAQAGAEAAV